MKATITHPSEQKLILTLPEEALYVNNSAGSVIIPLHCNLVLKMMQEIYLILINYYTSIPLAV